MNRQNTCRDAHWEICKICRCERCKCLHHSDWIATFHSLGAASSRLKCNVSNRILFIYIYVHLEEILWRYFKLHAVKYRNKKKTFATGILYSLGALVIETTGMCVREMLNLWSNSFEWKKHFHIQHLILTRQKKERCYF